MLLHHETWLPERPFSFVRPEPSEKKNDLSSDLSHFLILYYQLRAATMDGERSQWTLPRRLNVYREVANRGKLSYSYFIVQYETD